MTLFAFNFLHGALTGILFLALHTVVWRRKPKQGVFLLWGLAAVAYAASAGFVYVRMHQPPMLWGSFFFFACCVLAYTRFYITLTRTLTLRFLEELMHAPNCSLTEGDWVRIYSPRHAFRIRLPMLVEHGWMTFDGEKYHATKKSRRIGKLILVVRSMYGIHHAG